MKKIILFCCLAGLLSCQKDGSEYTIDSDPRVLVAIKENGQMVTGFVYDSLNRLIRTENYVNDSVWYSETYQYDAKSRMSQRIYSGFTETYEYDRGGDLISVRLVYAATGKEWKTEYQYARNRISKGITWYDGEKRGYIDFTYDSNGNTIERSEYSTTEGQADFLDSQFRLTFDDQVSPLKNPYVYPADITLKNNPVYYYHYLSVMSSPPKEYHATYDYDDEGYPIREYRGSRVLTWHYQVDLDNLIFEPSMKGWELYSWQTGGTWYYSILMGTNRIKTYEEVINNEVIAIGVDSLERMLDHFPANEEIFWIGQEWLQNSWPDGHGNLSLPDQEIINAIKEYCLDKKLVLRVN